MKNNEENIDKILRDRLSDRTFDGPPQDFLEDLNKRLDERENKGGFFGPWNGLFDILLLLLFLIYPFIEGNNTDQQPQLAEQTKQEQQFEDIEKGENNADASITPSKIEKQSDHETTDNEAANSIAKQQYSDISTTDSKNDQSNSTFANSNMNEGAKTASSNGNRSTPRETGNEFPEKNKHQSSDGDVNPDEKATDNDQGTVANSGNDNKTKKEEKSSYTKYLRNNANVYASQYPMVEPKIRNWDFPPILATDVNLSISDEDNVSSSTKATSPFGWEVQLSSGLNFPRLNKDKGINGSELILNEQSGFAPSFTIGGRITMWWNNFSLTSGADLLSVKEENIFEFNEIETYDSTYVSSVDTTVTFDSVNQQFDTTYTYYYDSTTVTDTTVNLVPVNQQYSWLQIPLQFGYRFQFNKWAIIPRAGINLAIGVRQTNKTYPNEAFDQLQSFAPSAKVLMNLSGSLEVRRQFGNWHIFARGDYQSGLRPILNGDYFQRRYSGFRANVGIGLTIK